MKHPLRILVVAALVGFPSLVVLGCPGVAELDDGCTREDVKAGGCRRCPVTCYDYDNEDAGDASADAAGDAGAKDAADAG
jgi:hypothetical protein